MAADQRHYVRRLISRAWKETWIVWNPYRWWISVAGVVFTLAIAVARYGWGVFMSLTDVAINAVGGCILAFAGSWAISLIRSFKLLDDDRASVIAVGSLALEESEFRGKALIAENAELKKPKRPRSQQILHEQAKSEIEGLRSVDVLFLRTLIGRGELQFEAFHQELVRRHGMSESDWTSALTRFRAQRVHLVEFIDPSPMKPNNFIQINPNYREVLLELLHLEDS